MSFLSSETLKAILKDSVIINPIQIESIKHGAYELSMGNEAFITTNNVKEEFRDGEQISIEAGQFGLLITKEIISVPDDLIAFISIKAGKKFRGLVNISGFHVDPGFYGRLKFSVYNAGSRDVVLTAGEATFLIWFAKLDNKTTDLYNGKRLGQMSINDNDVMNINGDILSPNVLNKKIDKIEIKFDKKSDKLNNRIKNLQTTLAIFITITIALCGWIITNNKSSPDTINNQNIETEANLSHDNPSID